jgi:hypothetical protein
MTIASLNETATQHIMQRVVVPFLLGRQAPFLSMNKALPAHRWFFVSFGLQY